MPAADLPERERLPRWREELARGIVRVDMEPLGSHLPFHDSIGLVVNLGPKAAVSQRGREMTLETGDAFLIRTDEMAVLTSTHHLGILLTRAALAARVRDLDEAMMRVIPRAVEPLRLLVSYLGLVHKECTPTRPELRQSVARHIHELAALAIGATRDIKDVGLSAGAAARVAAALAEIAESFADPEFTVEAVARRQGVTPRYLQLLLQASGTSFTARVNELRLQRAFALLTEAHDGRRRICDVAMDAGFSDITHFNRLFRARFGESPRAIRDRQ